MSHYADYLRDRTTDEILEDEYGFAVYRFIGTDTCYIVEIYTVPGCRQNHLASDRADTIVGIAKARGCTKLIGSVVPSSRNSTRSLKVLLGYGMQLDSSTNDFIVFRKDL